MKHCVQILLVSAAISFPVAIAASAFEVNVGGENGISVGVDLGGSGLDVGATIGGSNGVNADVGVGGSQGRLGANAGVGGNNGLVDANVGASVGGSRGLNAGVSANVGGPKGLANVGVNVGTGGKGAPGGNNGGGNNGGGLSPSQQQAFNSMSGTERQALLNRCGIINANVNAYDRELVQLCRMLQMASR